MIPQDASGSIELFWIPLGVRGSGFVRIVGKAYEALKARRDHRAPLALYHAALRVHTAEGPFAVEMVLPSRGGEPASRGVVLEGAVASPWLAWTRLFRYEVRCWRHGILLDDEPAAVGPLRLSDDRDQARRLLALTDSVPPLIWGRDQVGAGEMWNSNSMISWLLVKSGLSVEEIHAPAGARAPGWDAGLVLARRWAGGR
jgi:hypothetical protein